MTAQERHGWNEMAAMFLAFDEDQGDQVPMYGRICRAAAEDREVIDLLSVAPPGQRRPILLLAALHDLVLEHPGVPAGRWFPSVTGRPVPAGDPWPDVRATLFEHADRIRGVVSTRSTQTNEVGRSALWNLAVPWAATDVDAPVALVELGTSAGLNLRFDDYRVDVLDHRPGATGEVIATRGRAGSEVHLETAFRHGELPQEGVLHIVDRVGVDLDPVDLRDPERRRWLRACIWPEQLERFRRFDAAVATFLAEADPPRVVAGDAVDELGDVIESLPDDAHVVVIWSWFLTYLRRDRRAALDAALDLIGRSRPLTLISAEAPRVHPAFDDPGLPGDEPGEFRTIVGLSRWRDGHREDAVVGRCHHHVQWLDWLA